MMKVTGPVREVVASHSIEHKEVRQSGKQGLRFDLIWQQCCYVGHQVFGKGEKQNHFLSLPKLKTV